MKAVKNSHKAALIGSALMASCYSNAFTESETQRDKDRLISIELSAGVGKKTGDLQWSIASDVSGSETPNILSELTYSDLELDEFITNGKLAFNRGLLAGFSIEGRFLSGEASDGTNQDSDYHGDNRTQEYSRSTSDAKGSETTEFDLVIGYRVQLSQSWSITPKFAYTFNEQDLKMTNGVQVLDTRVMALSLGPFNDDLNSSYTAEWEGIWFGGDIDWRAGNHHITLQLQAHIHDYYAQANWNLREDFEHPVSFAHWAEGDGTRWNLKYTYQFARRFSAWIAATAEEFETDSGRDVVYFSDGTKGATKLNGVSWEASGYSFGVEFNF